MIECVPLDIGKHDLDKTAGLIYHTEPAFIGKFFGRDEAKAREKLSALVLRECNTFSHNHISIAVDGAHVLGVLVAYRVGGFSSKGEAREFLSTMGVPDLARLVFWEVILSRILSRRGNAGPDDFYISNLSVDAAMRGRGIGTALLGTARARAEAEGCSRMTLHVAVDNPRARSLYERYGFKETGKKVLRLDPRIGTYLMAKELVPRA
jgi:ribosomal protein S18 acetylase RimI-like enzyme